MCFVVSVFSGGAEVVLRAVGGVSMPALLTIVESILVQETSLVVQIEWSEQHLEQKPSVTGFAACSTGQGTSNRLRRAGDESDFDSSPCSSPVIGTGSSVNGSPGSRYVAACSDSSLSTAACVLSAVGRIIRPMPAGLMMINDEDSLTIASLTSPHSKTVSPCSAVSMPNDLFTIPSSSASQSTLHASSSALFARAIASVGASRASPNVRVAATNIDIELSPGRSPVALPSVSKVGSGHFKSLFSSAFLGSASHSRAEDAAPPVQPPTVSVGLAAPDYSPLFRRTQSSVSDERGECSSDVENDDGDTVDDDLVDEQGSSTCMRDISTAASRGMTIDATVDDSGDGESDCDSMEPCQSTDEDEFYEHDFKSPADCVRTAPPLPHRNPLFAATLASVSSSLPVKQMIDLPTRTSKLVSRLRIGNTSSSSSLPVGSGPELNYRNGSSIGFGADAEDTLTRVSVAASASATATDQDGCGIRSRRTLSSHAITIGGYESLSGGATKNHGLSPPAVELAVCPALVSGSIASPSANENGQLSRLALRAHSNALVSAKGGTGSAVQSPLPLPVSPPPKAQSVKSGTSKHSRASASSSGSASSNSSVFNLHARLHVLRTRVSDDLSPSLRRLRRSILFALVRNVISCLLRFLI
jgi:hypothetical protein